MLQPTLVQKKICLLGDVGVGKTSLVRRFTSGIFDEKYQSTVGVNISRKPINIGKIQLTQILWDLNGGKVFDTMLSSYCRGAAGAIIVSDIHP